MSAKRAMTAKQRYAFRYWRRGFKAIGCNLDRIALRNGIQFQISGRYQAITCDPGKWLARVSG